MSWTIEYLPEAKADLLRLDNSVRPEVVKGIRKVARKPEADGYGKPLGNTGTGDLSGLFKIKLKRAGLRVVYALQRKGEVMHIVIISAREDDTVYKEAEKRRKKHNL